MNNTYTTILATLVRIAFLWFMGALASHLSPTTYNAVNNLITQLGGTDTVVLSISGTVGLTLVAIWLKLKSKIHLNTALNLPKGSTTQDVANAAPSVMTALTNPQPK